MSLPQGFAVRLADSLLADATGNLLIGGSPVTAMRLSARARSLIVGGRLTVIDDTSAHLARRLLTTNLAHPDLADTDPVAADDLTVVIPVRDRAHQLDRALRALDGLHCIVIDDASRDGGAVAAVAARRDAAYVRLDQNVGPAAARNRGLTLTDTRYVAFVDSDVQVTATALLHLTRHFNDPEVMLVGPRVVGRPTSVQPRWFERYDAFSSPLTLGRTPSNVRPGATVAWLPSACLVARTDELGDGFDPTMRIGEDVDLVWRLVAGGHGVRYDPTVTASHDTRPTARSWLGRKFSYGTGGAPLAARHGDAVAPAVLAPVQAAAATVLLLRLRCSPMVAGVALVLTAARIRASLPEGVDRTALAARLSVRGLGWAVRQESALAVRHWWPAAVAAACVSRRARRALLSALLVDAAVALVESRREQSTISPALVLAGRRLDDVTYGAGLWWGALVAHSARVLMPRRPRPESSASTPRGPRPGRSPSSLGGRDRPVA